MKYIILLSAVFLLSSCTCLNQRKIGTKACNKKTGVIVVDIQGDFTSWKHGSLSVAGADKEFVKKVENATEQLKKEGYKIFATQDWHPLEHVSFYTNHLGKKVFEPININGRTQILWPPHCVQGTENARILLDNNLFEAIVKKGESKEYDSYSGFHDDGGQPTGMTDILHKNGIKKLIIYGIATDYCVRATAIDAVKEGFKVAVIQDLCKGVAPDTSEKALNEMRAMGITIFSKLDLQKIKNF